MSRVLIYVLCLIMSMTFAWAALEIQKPEFGSEFAFDKSPEISWSGCETGSYLLQIATDGLFDTVSFQQVVAESPYELEVELEANEYFLRIHAINDSGGFSCVSPTTQFSVKEVSPLAFFFDESEYASSNILRISMNGPIDARVEIEIRNEEGFFLPIILEDLQKPDFELELSEGTYDFLAKAQYADGELLVDQTLTLGTPTPQTQEIQENILGTLDTHNLSIKVVEFEGDPLDDVELLVVFNESNFTISTDASGVASQLVSAGEYKLFFELDGYVNTDKTINIEQDRNYTLQVWKSEDANLPIENETIKSIAKVDFKLMNESAYASSFVPITFEVDGSYSRCQVLSKEVDQPGYSIIQTVLNPAKKNEVILTELEPGEIQLRIRCIVSEDEAIISATQSILLIDIDGDRQELEERVRESEDVLSSIDGFPTSFSQIFIDDVVKLENYIAKARELIKQSKSSSDILDVQQQIQDLNQKSNNDVIAQIEVNDSQNIISYGTLDDAKLVTEYLDLSKSPKQLEDEQEQFAVRTSYNFVTINYASGLVLKQTFVANQVLTVQGVDYDISYDQYYILPTFLTNRLQQSNDLIVKDYGERSLVRLLENSSALIFDGWLDDTTLIKTIVLADSDTLSASPTGLVVSDLDIPTWRIPLFAFLIIVVVGTLVFNPYFSVMNMFEKNSLRSFTSKVHECIDASLAKEHSKVIQLIPKVLDIHEKLSKEEQKETTQIIEQVRSLFYDSTYQLTLKKISSKPANMWTYEELEVAIKDFYASYAKLSSDKQRAYVSYFNQVLYYAQDLLAKVKK